ncbi:unnamed protein product [Soboliphyme baturini]|uniref:CS domain-containing protein n=1 Tax=Soboliphyme baturini TaxID=241478 RepID=A0A183IMA1_9BILA|nr:unnamed protein product [Soboliphyme baturini]
MFSMIPEKFWPALHWKLENEMFDAGGYFTMCYCEEEMEESSGVRTPEGDARVIEPDTEASEFLRLKHGLIDWKVLVNREDGVDPEDPNW